jgi:hypothetical protein
MSLCHPLSAVFGDSCYKAFLLVAPPLSLPAVVLRVSAGTLRQFAVGHPRTFLAFLSFLAQLLSCSLFVANLRWDRLSDLRKDEILKSQQEIGMRARDSRASTA